MLDTRRITNVSHFGLRFLLTKLGERVKWTYMKLHRTTNFELRTTIVIGLLFLLLIGAGCDQSNDEQRTVNKDSTVVGIAEVFADNYPEKADSIEVKIIESDWGWVKGEVSMVGVDSHDFYAAKVKDAWDVIYDPEQNPYECALLNSYNFPQEMIQDCKKQEEEDDDEFTIEDARGIQMAFADMYHKNIEDINIRVSQTTANHARGTVQFAGERGGGMFLAVKDQGTWDVVVDGHGVYECNFVEPYDFPQEMVEDCYQP